MAKKQIFLNAEWSDQYRKSYAALQQPEQRNADRVTMALIKREPTPGMRVKPIEPDKYYNEARINDGDRQIFREGDGTIWFVDIVSHDDIGRYCKRPKGV